MSASFSSGPGQIILSAPCPEPLNAPTDDDVILYHQVWRALRKGSPTRAALPPEIVLYITKFAGWMLPNRGRTVKATDTVFVGRCLTQWGPKPMKASKRWFASEPFTEVEVGNIAALQLITVSRDNNWTTRNPSGRFSWFEVAIERQGLLVPQLQWKSHHNDRLTNVMTRVEGAIVPAPCAGLQVSDIITVWPYAQPAAWSNEAEWGELRFYNWFQPVIPLRIGES
ncbi:hypothetical protein PENSPDRAFT_664525 [Peniophora sp. CONT]|nr:hypothetical protein PENSPDRAFT_664525 [Peniophora sp. CONT]